MNPQKTKKRQQYTRDQFSDKQVYNQIKDQIRDIRQKNLKQVEQDSLINKLYEDKKRQMKIMKMQTNKQFKAKVPKEKYINDLAQNDEEQGQINSPIEQPMEEQPVKEDGAPSIQDLGEHIRPITLTRNKLAQLYKSRKFEETIKGCFVRYKSQNSNSYMLALIIGLMDTQKQYHLNNLKVRTLLRLQQSSSQIIKLTLDHVSNQHPPGNLQISKWLQTNRNKIPKQKQLKDKLIQLNNMIHGKVSSHDIDKNLLLQAEKVANNKQGTQNLNQLVFFMKSYVHDLTVTIQQLQGSRDPKDKQKLVIKAKQKKHYDDIFTKLIAKQAQLKAQRIQKEKQQKQEKRDKNKNPLQFIYNDRKHDKIKQVYHNKIQNICTFQGLNKIKQELQSAHRAFDIDIQI